ncbi:MAG: hypothetical protein KA731_03525 [Candidatus Moranbacteria bacterium]|nr:hypothetical protein [Candidatus Moranbacteria bacterium]MBP6034281.1 hypothetical protein [Candidatus Moranbacteria bacterium]MBP7695893.1 hypothetical protein [Candidatus Moranbacteria bacterium]
MVRIKSEGSAFGTTRVVETAVAASGLSCVQATRYKNDSIRVYYKDGSTTTGDTSEVASIGTGSSIRDESFIRLWGIECLGEYQKTGCYMRSVGNSASGQSDWDISFDPANIQACLTDDDEYTSDATISIVCCK